jgi:monofunctional biosynthetic peptidoglycan transglycosylase
MVKSQKKRYKQKGNSLLTTFFAYLMILLLSLGLSAITYVVYLSRFKPITTLYVLEKSLEKSAKPHTKWIAKSEANRNMKIALMAAEDAKFYEHWGVDWKAIKGAYKNNAKGNKRLVGGSTISQQVAKNVFLTHSRTYFRKLLEIGFTLLIELFWTKDRILEMYMNVAETSEAKFGVELAAKKYYNRSADELTRNEAIRIAMCLPNPKVYTPENVLKKRPKQYKRVLRNFKFLAKTIEK